MIEWWNEFWAANPDLKYYVSIGTIPFISGFVGWFTNMLALKMTFYPLRFWGLPGFWKIPPFIGWQGIIPRKAGKMASISTDIITERLIPVEEIYSRLDPNRMSKELDPTIQEITGELVEQIGVTTNENIWRLTPQPIKDQIIESVKNESPRLLNQIFQELKANIYNILDLKQLVIKNLTGRNVKKMVEMFQRCGGPEFRFIELSGLYFGFLFGLFQMLTYFVYAEGWTLPVAGVIVGYATNWLALQMIFRPQRPKRYGPVKYQGLFHKRQDEVSKEYAHLVATQILSARNIMNYILFGKTADTFFHLIQSNLVKSIDGMSEITRPAVNLVMGEDKYEHIREFAVEKLTEHVPRTARQLESYMDKALNLEETMYQRLRRLSPEEFEIILRSAFQEDELLLILVGAALGAMAGAAQWLLFFS